MKGWYAISFVNAPVTIWLQCYYTRLVLTFVSLAPQTHNTDPFVPAILSPSRYCTVPNLILLLIINTDT